MLRRPPRMAADDLTGRPQGGPLASRTEFTPQPQQLKFQNGYYAAAAAAAASSISIVQSRRTLQDELKHANVD